jgi:hypothetical protein
MKNFFLLICLSSFVTVVGGCNSNAQRKVKFRLSASGTLSPTESTPVFGSDAGVLSFNSTNWNSTLETSEILVDKGTNLGWYLTSTSSCKSYTLQIIQDGDVVQTRTMNMGYVTMWPQVTCTDGTMVQAVYIVD